MITGNLLEGFASFLRFLLFFGKAFIENFVRNNLKESYWNQGTSLISWVLIVFYAVFLCRIGRFQDKIFLR